MKPHTQPTEISDCGKQAADELKQTLREMATEAQELKAAAGGSVTDAVADWLAPQYLLAARAKLTSAAGAGRFEVLRTFLHDWAMLRHGDHTAERLHIERERLKLAKRDAKQKSETRIEAGLNALAELIKHNPKLVAAYKTLSEQVRAEEKPQKEKEFREWLQRPKIRKEILPELTRGLSPETLEKIERELRLL